MAEPQRLDLRARRNAPFLYEWDNFTDEAGDSVDFSSSVVRMQVRLYGAQAGTPLINLTEVSDPITEGVVADGDSIQVFIDEVSLRLLPEGKAGADVVFAYDLIVDDEVWVEGTFTVSPGVTDRLIMLTTASGVYLTGGGKYLLG